MADSPPCYAYEIVNFGFADRTEGSHTEYLVFVDMDSGVAEAESGVGSHDPSSGCARCDQA